MKMALEELLEEIFWVTIKFALVGCQYNYHCKQLQLRATMISINDYNHCCTFLWRHVQTRRLIPLLQNDLHWLPIKQRIDFQISVLSFKAINGLATPYLLEMFTPVAANLILHQNWSADLGNLSIQTVKNMSYGYHSFAIAGPSFWNSLLVDLHRSSSLTEFNIQRTIMQRT